MRHLIAVLFAPRETYEQLREKVDWATPLLVLGLLTALFNMIVDRTEFTLSDLVTNYGASVLQITVTVFLFGMILFTVKSLLRAESGTFRQLCKVKLFSMAPNLLYLLAKLTLLQVLGTEAVDAVGTFQSPTLQLVDVVFGVAMTAWSVLLLVIGTSVMIQKPGSSILGRLAVIWLIIILLTFLLSS